MFSQLQRGDGAAQLQPVVRVRTEREIMFDIAGIVAQRLLHGSSKLLGVGESML